VEPKLLCPDTNHAPSIEQDDANGYGVEHGLCGKAEALLDLPEGKDTYSLSCYAHNQEVCKVEGIVCNNRILQGSDDSDGSVKRVTEKEVA
jgi:hypothetical protein